MAPNAITTDDVEPSGSITMHVGLYETVRQVAENHGFTASTAESLFRVPEWHDIPSGYVIPDFMTDGTGVSGAVRDGIKGLDFKLREARVGEAAETDKSHFTAVAVRDDWDFEEIVKHLIETGQFGDAIRQISEVCPRAGVDPVDVVVYAIATYLKGVAAERLLTSTDGFSKAGVSNDQAGDDVYVLDGRSDGQTLAQVKCVTVDEQHDNHIYYQFTPDGEMVYGDDYKAVIQMVADKSGRVGDTRKAGNDIPKTVIGRTHTRYKCEQRPHVKNDAATYRYLGW